jgi:predicted nucleic acid-binding Zn ribbon protein
MSGLVATVMTHAATTHRAIHEIQRRWKRAVGVPLAARSRPVSLRRGVLSVEADDPGTAYALSLKNAVVLAQLRRLGAAVQEIAIRAGGRGPRQGAP